MTEPRQNRQPNNGRPVNKERSSKQVRQGEVLYVYDRICPKSSKQREILREYGSDDLKRSGAPRNNNSGARQHTATQSGPRRPSNQHRREEPPRQNRNTNQRREYGNTARNSGGQAHSANQNRARAYSSTRTSTPPPRNNGNYGAYARSGGYYGAAVLDNPLKILLEGIISFIDSVEERGRNDERIAKRRAIAAKRWSEYKHIIKTALIMLMILATFVTVVYRMFFVVKEINVEGSAAYGAEQIVNASGISLGDTLYSFSAEDVSDSITFHCPYIRTAELDRTVPSKVDITLVEDTAMYYANVWGDWLVLSPGLRVLEVTTAKKAEEAGLVKLIIPAVDYSVAGGTLQFTDARNERFIRAVLSDVESSQLGRTGFIDKIDLTNEYNIEIEYDGKYLLKFGGESELATKLLMAYKTITSERFEKGTPAKINLEKVGEANVRYDHSIGTN